MDTLLRFFRDQPDALKVLFAWSEAEADPFAQFHAIATALEEHPELAEALDWPVPRIRSGRVDFWVLRLALARDALIQILPTRFQAFAPSPESAREVALRTGLWLAHFAPRLGWTEVAGFTLGLLARVGQGPLEELAQRVKPFWRVPAGESLARMVAAERAALIYDELAVGDALFTQWGASPAWGRILLASRHPRLTQKDREPAIFLRLARFLGEVGPDARLDGAAIRPLVPPTWSREAALAPAALARARTWVEARMRGEPETASRGVSDAGAYRLA